MINKLKKKGGVERLKKIQSLEMYKYSLEILIIETMISNESKINLIIAMTINNVAFNESY